MRLGQSASLRDIIESRGSHHVSIYLQNISDRAGAARQLEAALERARSHLAPVLRPAEIKTILRPIERFLLELEDFPLLKGNVALFRRSRYFRAIQVPMEVESLCVVATSFHIKPLLQWLELENEGQLSAYGEPVALFGREVATLPFQRALFEYFLAGKERRTRRDLFEIGRAIARGRVKKLIIADGFNIFGTFDPKSGQLKLHPADLNHEDDCLLDDFAQEVLRRSGEVVLAPLSEMPYKRPALAILHSDEHEPIPAALPL